MSVWWLRDSSDTSPILILLLFPHVLSLSAWRFVSNKQTLLLFQSLRCLCSPRSVRVCVCDQCVSEHFCWCPGAPLAVCQCEIVPLSAHLSLPRRGHIPPWNHWARSGTTGGEGIRCYAWKPQQIESSMFIFILCIVNWKRWKKKKRTRWNFVLLSFSFSLLLCISHENLIVLHPPRKKQM